MAILLVGLTALLDNSNNSNNNNESSSSSSSNDNNKNNNGTIGVIYILAGAFVQSLQYAFEEKVMNMDISAVYFYFYLFYLYY